MKRRFFILVIACLTMCSVCFSQDYDKDALVIKDIHDFALTKSSCYDWLTHLTTKIGGRLAGSKGADKAVVYTKEIMDTMHFTNTELQACEVKNWHRGEFEVVEALLPNGERITLNALALGNSIGTSQEGFTAEVVEVSSLDEVEELGEKGIKNKIVFYNRPMDATQYRTFNAYGGAVDQRVWGASRAAKFGGLCAVVRSMTLRSDDFPHTGTLAYPEGERQAPGIAISTNDSDRLSELIKDYPGLKLHVKMDCHPGEIATSYNVIGEIKGTEFPDEIIVVGGHLDSWDVGQGAHDDGAGCVHSLEVINILNGIGYKPKRTIRCVMFMNEENGLAGGREYARVSNEKGEYHLFALESDAGGFVPRGFSFDGHPDVLKPFYAKVSEWLPLFESKYGLYFTTGGSGADISPLKGQKGLLAGLRPDSQRYFDYHHTTIDRIEAVNKRELELGAAAMASLIYLIDKYGLK